MSVNSHIAAVEPEATPAQAENRVETPETDSETWVQERFHDAEEETERNNRGWWLPLAALTAIAAWTGFFVYAHLPEMLSGGTLVEWSSWIVSWSVPVLLAICLWLLAMRSSRREAARFGNVARLLSDESSRLETRMITINRELSLAREFIAAQSRDLESLGRVASERINESADKLSGLVSYNSAQIDSIANVSGTAMVNMEKLRGDLPVIANSARDVASQIGNAGRNAQSQLEELINGFHRLNSFGEASEQQVETLRSRVNEAIAEFENQSAKLEQSETNALATMSERLALIQRESESFGQSLRDGEDEAQKRWLAAITTMQGNLSEALQEISRIDAAAAGQAKNRLDEVNKWSSEIDAKINQLTSSFTQDLEARRSAGALREAEEVAAFENRMQQLDAAIAARQETQLAQWQTLSAHSEALALRLDELGRNMETVSSRGSDVGAELSRSVELLNLRLGENRQEIEATESLIAELTEASIRLLELIQAGASHSREQLPEAIGEAQRSLESFEQQAKSAGQLLVEADERSERLAEKVLATRNDGTAALNDIETLHNRIAIHGENHAEQITGLRDNLAALAQESEDLSLRVRGELSEAVSHLQGALKTVLDELDNGSGEAVARMADRIGNQSAEAIDRAIRLRSAEAIGGMEQAAAHASGVSREAARQLRDQLAKVDELVGNLENRVERARERAEEQVDNDFARRMALITESLNSNSIDIAKALSNDVTDTAWASYLRGDRGIFTRRAVRLLDNSEAREIAEIYERDSDFREHVSRYIHDFEAMLRSILSTRDGHALSVTLLSSDMGKLYVALAQGIDRLRS